MRRALADVVHSAHEYAPIEVGDRVVDIGANDGTLLANYLPIGENWAFRIAYEPAGNLWEACKGNCELLIRDFFPSDYMPLGAIRAKHIFTVAMFYDLEDPNRFVAAVKEMLHPQGIWVNQMAYLPSMLDTTGYDNICHEHLEYYSLTTLQALLSRHQLQIIGAELNSVNGGSFRCYITHMKSLIPVREEQWSNVRRLMQEEDARGLATTNEPYTFFASQAEASRKKLLATLLQAKLNGWQVDLYGASTKGSVIAQYCGLGPDAIRWAIERSPDKMGRYTVTGIPIVSEEQGRKMPADLWIVLPWAFRDAFITRESRYLHDGGIMYFPLPSGDMLSGVKLWLQLGPSRR